MFYDGRRRPNRLRDWQWRVPVTAAFLLLFVLTSVNWQPDGSVKVGTPTAEAATCVAREGREIGGWHIKTGTLDTPTIANARFGATICYDSGARITGVSPYLYIGATSTGASMGVDVENWGAWVSSQTSTYVEVSGRTKYRMCWLKLGVQVCSLTHTQTYRLRWYSVYGPYPSDRMPGIVAYDKWCSLTGCASQTLRVRVY